jgi:hypothetical protein
MPTKLPPHCYWRKDTIWGRVIIAGSEHRRSLRTADAKEAARRIRAWQTKLERQQFGDVEAPGFKEAVLRWAKEVLPGSVKPAVAKRYLVSIRQMAGHFGDLRVTEIDAASISSYISSRSGVATNATIRRDLTALSRLLSSCMAWGWLQRNQARLFDRSIIRERRDPISPPADDDVEIDRRFATRSFACSNKPVCGRWKPLHLPPPKCATGKSASSAPRPIGHAHWIGGHQVEMQASCWMLLSHHS